MGDVADFSKYKALKDYDQSLIDKGWSATRLTTEIETGIAIYVYDDFTGLLLFSVIDQNSLFEIRERVGTTEKDDLLSLAEKLNLLVTDLADTPPDKNDMRLPTLAHTAAWFTGFLLALIKKPDLKNKSIVLLRLSDSNNQQCAFRLIYLDWPDIMARKDAVKELSAIASSMRGNFFGSSGS